MKETNLSGGKRSSNESVLPETNGNPRVSLTGFTNILLDKSNPDKILTIEEERERLRVRFAELPSMSFDGGNVGPFKRKYSEALQILKPFRPASKDGKIPISKAGFFSYIFLTWFSPLVWRMYKHRDVPVSESDVWECSDMEGVLVNTERMKLLWSKELHDHGPEKASFLRVWVRFIFTRSVASLMILVVNALVTFLSSALLVNKVLQYLESAEDNLLYGLGLTAAIMACEVVRAITFANIIVFSAQTGTRFRSGFIGILYDKLLKLRVSKGKTNSEIINAFSVDSYRVYIATWTTIFIISVPVYLIIGTVYAYTLIGYWCFVSVGTFIVCYMTQVQMTGLLKKMRKKCSQHTDMRVRRMGEILNSMKFIKLYAWEKPFNEAIKNVRKSEQKYLLYSALLDAVVGAIIPVTPTIASVVTITVYTAAGNDLNASTAFAIIGTMNFLRIIVALIPIGFRAYGEAKVSFRRIEKLLTLDEFSSPSPDVFNKENAVEIKAANFICETVADDEETKTRIRGRKSSVASSRRESVNLFQLSDIELEVRKGQLIGICGSVGSGKSSLMSAILGRMMLAKGHLAVSGTVAYVAQQAWIFNASIKENILFGQEYKTERYSRVIACCGLETDFDLLKDGDETEIGERGVNLSGGQKQRVNLARAVYSKSDIYILDDPLSALDTRVGKQIFNECIKQELHKKTVILVTHQLQYLKDCDEVLVMENGTVVEKGHHLELMASDGKYSEMFRIFNLTEMKSRKIYSNNDGAPVESEVTEMKKDKKEKPAEETNGIHKPKAKGKLVQAEETAIGDVGVSTYTAYIRAAGGWFAVLGVILFYFLCSGSLVFSDYWLSAWLGSLPKGSYTTNTTMENIYMNTTLSSLNTTMSVIITNNSTAMYANGMVNESFIGSDTYFVVYISSLAGIIVLILVNGFCHAKVSLTASKEMHDKCLDRVMKAPMSFFDTTPTGRILNRFSKDLDEGDVFIPQVTNQLVRILSLTIVSIGTATYVTPWLLIAVVPVVAVFYVMKQVSTVSVRQLKRLENITRSPLISNVNVTSQGLSTIVAYRQQDRFFKRCVSYGDVASMSVFLFDVSMRWIGLRLDLIAGLMTMSSSLIFVVTKGLIPPASAGLVLGLCGKTISIVQFLIRLMNETEARFTSVERLHEYTVKLGSENQDAKKKAPSKWPEKGAITFRNVVMRYRPDIDPVLKDVSFEIKPREKVGIVGRTGAGKSSLATVLFRLVELTDGVITIDGEDISELNLNIIRSKISTITQEPVLFSGTIRYNIDPFSLFTDETIWEALGKVHMKEKIKQFNQDLDTMVEENGENFSVGERQLLCLARAVVRSSKILLLDEATANIDTSTDAMIQQTIRECFADCTVITIAHRLNTVLHSDKILVLDSGKVMECGSPQELLSNPYSFFNAMVTAQSVKTPSP
ncbi:ATP-binding cassette sub-family C member 5-like [Dreissena polymorpha]|uniref:ATP-binding cassette sub-family C member 5-like n=1 Tax=Dreissena polymorpha TaxID=45954 RepID=UPI0022654478|nr:ATP-binding cassette sub-family C member 5-like [Dreissena polymorpha]